MTKNNIWDCILLYQNLVEKPRHSMLGNIKDFHVKRKLLRGYELVTRLTEALVRP